MFAQLTRLQGTPDKIAEAVRCYYVDTIPAAGDLAGFSGGYLLADRATGALVSFTTWSSEADLRAAEQPLGRAMVTLMETAGTSGEPSIERYEVIGQAAGNLTQRPS
jgi:heme-degrading monooxygenase HmoA